MTNDETKNLLFVSYITAVHEVGEPMHLTEQANPMHHTAGQKKLQMHHRGPCNCVLKLMMMMSIHTRPCKLQPFIN